MIYKTNWLRGILGPMLVSCATVATAVPSNIAANAIHTAFIDNGAVFAMGYNKYGEVAPASGAEFWTPYFTGIQGAKSVAVNWYRTAVLKTDGSIIINGIEWVLKQPSQRTLNVSATDVAITQRDTYYVSGGTLYRLVDGQEAAPVAGGTNVKYVAAGMDHVIVLFNDGTVGGFGKNAFGQLGNGTTVEATSIVKLSLTGIVEIAAGESVTALRNSLGEVFVFGKNDRGFLGTGTTTHQLTPYQLPGVAGAKKIAISRNTTSYLKSDDTLWTAGWHNYIEGALYNYNTTYVKMPIGTVIDYAAGGDYVIVNRGTVGKLEGWGGNGNGKLGDGSILEKHQISSAFFTPIAPPPPPPEPVVVAEPVPEPAPAPAPEVTDTAIAMPLAPEPVATIEPTPVPTTTEIVVNMVVDAVTAVVDAVVAVVNTVIEVISPTPVPEPTPIPAPTPVVLPPAPVIETKVKCNNGWGNGDQCAPGKSGSKNNAENAVVAKADPTAKAKK